MGSSNIQALNGGGGGVVRRGGGCGTLSMAAISFENDAQIVVFKTVNSIIDFDSSVWTKPCYPCHIYI